MKYLNDTLNFYLKLMEFSQSYILLTLSADPPSAAGLSRLNILWYWGGNSGFNLNAPPVAVDEAEENALRKIGSFILTTYWSSPSSNFD